MLLSKQVIFCLLLYTNSITACNNNSSGQSTKEAMINNSNSSLNFRCHFGSICDGLLKVQVHNVVAIVGNSNFVTVVNVGGAGPHSKHGLAACARGKGGNGSQGVLVAEWSDLNRNGKSRSESIADLGLVHNHNELLGTDLHHLLAKKSSTSTLDKIQVRVDFIGSIDGDVELGMRVQRYQRNSEFLCLFLGANRSGNAHNVFQFAAL
mmetsp:Transcript_34267/g.50376  ORF Transcript_34267/g.50376 Transcript_34267/m.50376 type:complete len:208 (+) Transcript_34267:25-648(+)